MALRSSHHRAVVGLLCGASAIAFAPILTVMAGDVGRLEPTVTAFWRVALATPLLFGVLAITHNRQARSTSDSIPSRWALIAPGAFFAGDLAAWHSAMEYISAGLATLLGNLAVVIVPLFGWLLLGERYTKRHVTATLVALAGTVLVMLPPGRGVELSLPSRGDAYGFGNFYGLLTAFFYAAYQLSVKRARRHYSTLVVLSCSAAVCAAILLPVCFFSSARLWPSDTRAFWALGALVLVSHCLGQGLIAWSLGHLQAGLVALLLLWQPLAATILSVVLLEQRLGVAQGFGVALVLVGLALPSLRPARSRCGPQMADHQ